MNVSRRYPARLVLALAAAALVLMIGAVAAFGQAAAPTDHASGGGVSGSSGSTGVAEPGTVTVGKPDIAVGSGIAAPSWCCGTSGSVPGLTTYGQATVDGQGQAARDAAIVKAVQDATAQANAAAPVSRSARSSTCRSRRCRTTTRCRWWEPLPGPQREHRDRHPDRPAAGWSRPSRTSAL